MPTLAKDYGASDPHPNWRKLQAMQDDADRDKLWRVVARESFRWNEMPELRHEARLLCQGYTLSIEDLFWWVQWWLDRDSSLPVATRARFAVALMRGFVAAEEARR